MSVRYLLMQIQPDGKTLCGYCGYYVPLDKISGEYYVTTACWNDKERHKWKQPVGVCERCI